MRYTHFRRSTRSVLAAKGSSSRAPAMTVVGSGTTVIRAVIPEKIAPVSGPVMVITVGSELASSVQTVSYSTQLPKNVVSIGFGVVLLTWVAPGIK